MATSIDSFDDLYEDLRVAGPSEYGDDLLQLQFVLENQAARALFVEYSAASFAAENVRFLTALFDSHRYLLDNISKHPELRKALKDHTMQTLYSNYIVVGAPLEVNLSHKTRNEIIRLYQAAIRPEQPTKFPSDRALQRRIAILVDASTPISSSSPPPAAPLQARGSRSPSVSTSPRRRFALRPIDTNPRRHAPPRRPASATPRRPTPKHKISPSARFFGRSSDDLVPDLDRTSSSTGPKISPRSRGTSVESREEDEADEIIEWLRPAIEEIANLVLEDTWNRFKKSSAYDKFCDLYSSSAQTQDLDALADDRRNFNIVQIMHRSGYGGRASLCGPQRPSSALLSDF